MNQHPNQAHACPPHRPTTLVVALLLSLSHPTPSLATSPDPFGVSQAIGLAASPSSSVPSPLPTITAAPATPPATFGSTVLPTNTPVPPTGTVPSVVTATPPQLTDYSTNLNSDVFGANLFTGTFAPESAGRFNPDYAIAIGDNIQVRFWGAFEYDAPLTVDPQGNLFIPHVGPVNVLGVRNQDLQALIENAVRRVYRANVYSYASLAAAQPVRIFVSGFVNRPGLYSGTSLDSLLHYLDQAGGIDVERGSFLNIQVKRGHTTRATLNLYDFILDGKIPLIQLSDGDVIFVTAKQKSVKVNGLAANAKRFEFNDHNPSIADLIKLAKPSATATHVRVTRNTGTTLNVEYYPLSEADHIALHSGDDIAFTADKKQGTITVRVEGEHLSVQEYVIPYGTRLGTLMSHIRYTDRADKNSLQLFRASVITRQKDMLAIALKRLEASVLTVRAGTEEEAQLRSSEAALMLQWVDRAKSIEPSGQVMLSHADHLDQLLLENEDVIRIPAIDNLVLVSGEVMFPNTIALDSDKNIDDYIDSAGGYSQKADTSRIIIAHRDGSFEDTETHSNWFSHTDIRPGDEIMVLPAVDPKYRQLFKEVSTMIYQMALGARVVLK